jgi:hypothetical protein
MLTGLEILGVVSAVIQIVDFSRKLVSQTQEIYRSASGATKDNVTSNEIAKDINALYQDLRRKSQTFQRLSPDDIAVGNLVDSCERKPKPCYIFSEN